MSCYLSFTAIDTELFPANYLSGRQRWLAELGRDMNRFSYPCSVSGPDHETLFTDTVWIGQEDATKVLVLLGGTHGVEGFVGSAVETDILRLIAEGQLVIPVSYTHLTLPTKRIV